MTDVQQQTIEEQENGPLDPEAPYNASDRRHVKAKAQDKKTKQRERDEVLTAVLLHKNGRAWLGWLLKEVCGLHSPTENGAYDTNALHYREGARAVGLAVQAEALRVNRTNYLKLLEETL